MTAELYEKIAKPFRVKPWRLQLLKLLNKTCTAAGFVLYPVLLFLLIQKKDSRIVNMVLIPGISFVLLSVIRSKINKPRPYESLAIDPLIRREKKGNSFPSRHVFSIFVIAGCWYGVSVPIGAAICICGVLLALIRVIGGVHYPEDVAAGAVIGLLCGLLAAVLHL